MRRFDLFALVTATAVVSFASITPAAAEDPTRLGPRLHIETDDNSDAAIGVELRSEIGRLGRNAYIDLRPSFDYYLFDDDGAGIDVTLLGFGMDALFRFEIAPSAELYGVAGLEVFLFSVDTPAGDDSDTEVGVNLGAGLRFLPNEKVQPFVELRATVGDVEPVLLGGGILFAM
jgi:hypothetical protein